uniref:Uncharacterized protein AlNc14C618G12255 n=1 Tax=Albugo laibachii Nc14 TaxID=890382 RepID=F0X1G4_9STRA|nr:conserved hypothetical protein [Albugo laibachii Nc14]|eukprot:CCA27650.1 conserved hypothetical protein [Albugo laibachii Nc14]
MLAEDLFEVNVHNFVSLQFFGENTEEKRITDAPMTATNVSDGVYKPLYERLKKQREEKDNEWKEKHNPFAPPKALDDEEITFIRQLETKKQQFDLQRKEQQEHDRAAFLVARNSKAIVRPALPNITLPSGQTKTKKIAAASLLRVRSKKRVSQERDERIADSSRRKQRKENLSSAPISTKVSKPIIKLVAYDGDSDDG